MSTTTPRRSRSGAAPSTEPRSTRTKATPKSKKSTSKNNNLTAPQSAKSSKSRSRSSSKTSDSESQELAASLDDTSGDSTDNSTSRSSTRRSPRLTASQEPTDQYSQPRPVSPIVQSPPEPAPFAPSGKVARTPMKRLTHSKNHKSIDQPNHEPVEHSDPVSVNHSNHSVPSPDQPSSLLVTNQEALPAIPSPHHSTSELKHHPVKRSPVKRPAQDVLVNQPNNSSVKTPTSGKKRKSAHLETADEFIDEPIDQLEYSQPHTIPASLEDNLSPINHPIHHSPAKQSASKQQPVSRTPIKHQTVNRSLSKHQTENITSSQTINESNNHSIANSPSQSPRSPRRTSLSRTPQPQPEQLVYPAIFPDVDQFVDHLLHTLDERINTSTHALLAVLNTTHRPKDQIEAISKHVYDSVGETFDLTRPRWAEFVKKIVFSISDEEKFVIDAALESPPTISNEEMTEAEIAEQELDDEISKLQESILTNHAILQQKREQLASIETQLAQHEQIRALFADASPARAAAFQAKVQSIKKAWIQFQETLQQAKETKANCQWSETTKTEVRTVKAAVTYQPDMIDTEVLKSMTMKTNTARLPI